eukprot:4916424-Alexandrium_andersonii.AAC.1
MCIRDRSLYEAPQSPAFFHWVFVDASVRILRSRSAARSCSRVGRSSELGWGRCADVGRSVRDTGRLRTVRNAAEHACIGRSLASCL